MIKNILFFVFIIFSFSANGLTRKQVNVIKNSAIAVETGSGVVIKLSEGYAYALTAHHVVDDAISSNKGVNIILIDNAVILGEVMSFSKEKDIALIRFKASKSVKESKIAKSDPYISQTVYIMGNPVGMRYVMTKGILSKKNAYPFGKVARWQTDAKIMPGNSGGPVYNDRGELLGLALSVHAYSTPIFHRLAVKDLIPIGTMTTGWIFVPHLGFMSSRSSICEFVELDGNNKLLDISCSK